MSEKLRLERKNGSAAVFYIFHLFYDTIPENNLFQEDFPWHHLPCIWLRHIRSRTASLADAYISRAVETCIQEIAVLGNGQAGIDEIAWAWRR